LGLILQLAIDKKGRIWVASYTSGLCMYDGKTVRKYDSNDGFPFDFAYSILTDRIDNIWVGTQKGVYKIVADEKGNLINVKVFNKNHGLSFEEMNGNAIFLDSKERIWVGHLKGVSYYDPKHDAENQINPVTYINQVNLGLEITNWKDSLNWQYYSDLQKWTWIPTKLELPSYLNSINLTFSSNSYRIPQEVRFQWKLSPIDKDWQSITNRTEASYAGLSQGKYTFNVRSVNESGVWSEPTQFSFIIQPPFWQTWWFRLTGFVLVTGVVFSGFRARVKSIERKKQELEKLVAIRTQEVVKQKDEILAKNTELEQQQEEILAQREEIEKRNHLLADANESLHESNRNITSSINYAKRIQEAMLPNPSKLSKTLPHFMLFFDPRDIVSGDFYWFYERDKGKKQWIAAVDCTGHGVPGAFMSLVGMNQLNDILDKTDEDLQPNEILNKLNLRIRRGLKQDETQNRDGMDMALCMIDHEARTISFAGAKNPLVIINEKGIQTIKGDRIPIGGLQKEGGHRFTNHQFSLDEFSAETTFYMFSDGFQDQFGGIRGSEKYTSKRFRELLASIYHKSPENQIEILKSTLREWIGHEKRLDDILVVGFRVV
jgi:serine phosphatase RsbU (regulator of sigma subunit)